MERAEDKDIQKAAAILKKMGARKVFLFGSRAKGKARPGSDLDLAISGLKPELFFKAVAELMFSLDHEVHLIDLDSKSDFTDYLKRKEELVSVE